MYNLNVSLSAPPLLGSVSCTTPRTPEILNSVIAMTNPMDTYQHQQQQHQQLHLHQQLSLPPPIGTAQQQQQQQHQQQFMSESQSLPPQILTNVSDKYRVSGRVAKDAFGEIRLPSI